MADWEESLSALLQDPDAMGQIMTLAERLGGGESASSDSPPLFDPSDMGRLFSLVKDCGGTDERTAKLLSALRPFLREDSRRMLDRAQKLTVLSRVARKLWRDGELHL